MSDDQEQFASPADAADEAATASAVAPPADPVQEEPEYEDYDSVMTPEEIAAAEAEEEAASRARGPRGPVEIIDDGDEEIVHNWYILKVQSNRERSVAAALQRKVKIEGIDRYFGEICVPTEKVTEFKAGKKKIVERKLWPGYIAVQMHVNDATWFAIRETSGIGDFTGASGKPVPMQPHEIAMITKPEVEESTETPKLNIRFKVGDKVKVKDGNFESFEGDVGGIDEASGKVTIMISIFGRSTPVELEYWQVETI